jgi:hypothetical protein
MFTLAFISQTSWKFTRQGDKISRKLPNQVGCGLAGAQLATPISRKFLNTVTIGYDKFSLLFLLATKNIENFKCTTTN